MKKTIRQELIEILNESIGDSDKGIIFDENSTRRRSPMGGKRTKYDLKTSQSWSAESVGNQTVTVSCVGMTMAEFIKEAKCGNVHYLTSNDLGFPYITFYSNTPEFITNGYVKGVSKEKNTVELHISDLIRVETVSTNISPNTPKWVLDKKNNQYPVFTCKIYQGWRFMDKFNFPGWEKVWKTFRLKCCLSEEELSLHYDS